MYQDKEPFPYNEQDTAIAISVSGRANGFIADEILPYSKVNNRKYNYRVHDFGDELQTVDDTISEKGAPNEVEFSGTKETGHVVDRGLKHTYTNEQVAEMSGRNPLGNRIQKLTNTVLRNREIRVMKACKDSDNANVIETLTPGGQIGDDGVKTIEIIEDLRLSMLFRGNALIGSETVISKIRRAQDVIRAFNGTTGSDGMVPMEWLSQYLNVDKILVGKAIKNAAQKGLPAQVDNVWDSDFLSLAYINPTASTMSLDEDVTFGLTARWHGPGSAKGGRVAGRKRIDVGLHGGWEIRSGESVKEEILSKDCLAIVNNPVALD